MFFLIILCSRESWGLYLHFGGFLLHIEFNSFDTVLCIEASWSSFLFVDEWIWYCLYSGDVMNFCLSLLWLSHFAFFNLGTQGTYIDKTILRMGNKMFEESCFHEKIDETPDFALLEHGEKLWKLWHPWENFFFAWRLMNYTPIWSHHLGLINHITIACK